MGYFSVLLKTYNPAQILFYLQLSTFSDKNVPTNHASREYILVINANQGEKANALEVVQMKSENRASCLQHLTWIHVKGANSWLNSNKVADLLIIGVGMYSKWASTGRFSYKGGIGEATKVVNMDG